MWNDDDQGVRTRDPAADGLFAVPLSAMEIDTANHQFIFDQSKEKLKTAPGFDKDNWPDMSDPTWATGIHAYYGTTPYADDRL